MVCPFNLGSRDRQNLLNGSKRSDGLEKTRTPLVCVASFWPPDWPISLAPRPGPCLLIPLPNAESSFNRRITMVLYYHEVSSAATVAIATLVGIGISPCFVGGMACKLYGNNRTPEVCPVYIEGCHGHPVVGRRLPRSFRGPRYPVSPMSMGRGGIKAEGGRSQSFILPRPRQNSRRHL